MLSSWSCSRRGHNVLICCTFCSVECRVLDSQVVDESALESDYTGDFCSRELYYTIIDNSGAKAILVVVVVNELIVHARNLAVLKQQRLLDVIICLRTTDYAQYAFVGCF